MTTDTNILEELKNIPSDLQNIIINNYIGLPSTIFINFSSKGTIHKQLFIDKKDVYYTLKYRDNLTSKCGTEFSTNNTEDISKYIKDYLISNFYIDMTQFFYIDTRKYGYDNNTDFYSFNPEAILSGSTKVLSDYWLMYSTYDGKNEKEKVKDTFPYRTINSLQMYIVNQNNNLM